MRGRQWPLCSPAAPHPVAPQGFVLSGGLFPSDRWRSVRRTLTTNTDEVIQHRSYLHPASRKELRIVGSSE